MRFLALRFPIKLLRDYTDLLYMGFVSVVLPNAVAPAVPTQTSGAKAATSSSSTQSNAANVVGQAAIVTLSAEAKARSVSSGDSKRVDSSFDSKESGSKESKKAASKKKKKASITVSA